MSASGDSLLTLLRAATGEQHRALDRAFAFRENAPNLAQYAAFLRGSLAALEPLEAALSTFSPHAAALSRTQLLRGDLASLGVATDVAPVSSVPVINSEASAFGARYVIEGSALGGALLARSFDAALGLGGASQRFLTLHGSALAEHWRGFLEELAAFDKKATNEMRALACDTARAVFDLYRAAFGSTGALHGEP